LLHFLKATSIHAVQYDIGVVDYSIMSCHKTKSLYAVMHMHNSVICRLICSKSAFRE